MAARSVTFSFEETTPKTTPPYNVETEAYVYGAEADTIVYDRRHRRDGGTAMTRDDTDDSPADLRERAARDEEIADALEDLLEELRDEDIKGSRLEGLFDEVSSSNPNIWNIVSAFIDVEDGEAIVTDESKLAQGSWAPEIVEGCDTMITLEIEYGMMPDEFAYTAGKKLTQRIEEFRERAAEARERADELEDD
ncbi:hypothetical protein C488_04547 [Natrinema pellirubrum DSM 15624]|uniref:Uncharacterized protein n=2 Tax=Natrinema pellirubrum TaxID=69525 RepID=L0JHR7_NATP1|nr:hypothetical protein Natpe_0453 [Natrinema pellirubrum DSM 15624]ELY79389.1 hypothetical protein C488_04547 [Natrinema pellirubrum DSM 15624]